LSRTAIILLKYYERYFQNTLNCIKNTQLPVFIAERDGVGNMSRAFNTAFRLNQKELNKYEYIWFVTNIEFLPDVPIKLEKALDTFLEIGAIHPEFRSDHPHLLRDGSEEVKLIPFIEFTAPFFRREVFSRYMLDEDHWYYYMDLIISKQMKLDGIKMACHHGAKIFHTYLRNNSSKESVTLLREKLRDWREKEEREILARKFGKDWEKYLFDYTLS
jgi:hypothetical protein